MTSSLLCRLSSLLMLVCVASAAASPVPISKPKAMTAQEKAAMAARVRSECLKAWEGYKKYAWGHDELKPLSHQGSDWYGQSLLITPVDALDTLLVMGLTTQADEDRKLIDTELNLNRDEYVSTFEITIRLLGGLISGYEMTGDKRLLELAQDLGHRLLPAFESPTGMPYTQVNLHSGAVRRPGSNPAQVGSLLLEFGTLSKLTGDPVFYDKAKRALTEMYKRSLPLGLVGAGINVETGAWTDTTAGVMGGTDSYYEYLLKAAILFDDRECAQMWAVSGKAIDRYLADPRSDGLWYGQAKMADGTRTTTYYGALDAFYPAVLVLAEDVKKAGALEDASFRMWNINGIEPDKFDYVSGEIKSPRYPLRPEIIESAYYLYHATHDAKYLAMGETFLDALVKYCGTGEGFASLGDVRTKEKRDSMGSYLFAETFKYLYLLFAPPSAMPFDSVIFNTEAHPLKRSAGKRR